MTQQERVDITFGTSAEYVIHVAAVIASIVKNAPGANLRFILLHAPMPDELKRNVEKSAPNATFFWNEVGDDDLPAYADRRHFTRAILFRLSAEKLAPADCKRVIYLDADLIVCGDIRKLWEIDLGGAPIGAVKDAYMQGAPFAEEWKLPPGPYDYFNSGVLLIDLEKVRTEKLFTKTIDFVARHSETLKFADQCALNYVFWSRWKPLPPTWNAHRDMVVPWKVKNLPPAMQFDNRLPAIVHYTEEDKPWIRTAYHPWSWLYWKYLKRSAFLKTVSDQAGMNEFDRFKLWVRWLRRKPSSTVATV